MRSGEKRAHEQVRHTAPRHAGLRGWAALAGAGACAVAFSSVTHAQTGAAKPGAAASAPATQAGAAKGSSTAATTAPASSAPPATSPRKPTDAEIAEAKRHMEAAAAFYNDPSGRKCEDAYREFKLAYELSGGTSLNAAKGVGNCALELERDGEAIEFLDKYLKGRGDNIDPADRLQVESDLKALRSSVVWITFKSNRVDVRLTDTRTQSKGLPITNRYKLEGRSLRVGLHRGSHTIVASTEGAPDVTWNVELDASSPQEKSFEFGAGGAVTPPPEQPPPSTEVSRPVPAYAWAMLGVTVGALGGWGGTMGWASATKADYDRVNGTVPLADATRLRGDVETANLVADILLGVSGASALTTIVLIATRPSVASAKAARLIPTPVIPPSAQGGLAVGVGGRF